MSRRLSSRHSLKAKRPLVGNGLLLLYLFVATPFLPASTALLAATDRSHHVAIQQTSHGIQIVLQHECTGSPSHRHGMVARALTFFAQRTTAAQPDHVIQFAATDPVQQALASAAAPPPQASALDEVGVGNVRWRPLPLNSIHATFARPPPTASKLLLTVRSTVLLV